MSKRDTMERRAYSFEIRAEDTEGAGIIEGRPIVYESKTDLGFFDEIIKRGALKNTNLKDVRFLVNHDMSRIPLARSRNNNERSTMQLMPDDDGLAIRVRLDVENNSEARALYSAVQRGDITGMSFLFGVDEEDWSGLDTDHPTRTIISIAEVLEVSAVTFPAYEATEIETRSKGALDSARARATDIARHNAPDGAEALELEKARNRNLLIIWG